MNQTQKAYQNLWTLKAFLYFLKFIPNPLPPTEEQKYFIIKTMFRICYWKETCEQMSQLAIISISKPILNYFQMHEVAQN